MDERRQSPRMDVEVEVHYRTAQEFVAAYGRNISGGGLFVSTTEPHALNQPVLLRFTLPGVDHRFEIKGIVVWSHSAPGSSLPSGMGVKFVQIAPEDTKRILDFVKKAGLTLPGVKEPKEKKKA